MLSLVLLLATLPFVWAAPASQPFHFVLLGDRTGETRPGIYEQVLRAAAHDRPAFMLSVGDTIQGLNDATAAAEWKDVEKLLTPYRRFPLYLAPGNHDVWSELSEQLYQKYSGHPLHYGFDYGQAHFTILDNSRSEQLSSEELAFLEQDLKHYADQPVKFIVSHRPSWILNVMLRNPEFPLHQLARRYGVRYVIAGHIHQMIHLELEGITYLSLPSAGGHLRASGKYEDGWFFGFTSVAVGANQAAFEFHELKGRTTAVKDWGAAGLTAK